MQWIDYALLGIILISTVVSAFRGLIKEILSMLAWAVAFFVAMLVIKKTGLSGTDRVLGMFFGLLRGGAIVLVAACTLQLAFNYGFLLKLKEESWYKQSMLVPDVMKFADELLKSFGLGDAGKNFNLFESLKSDVHKDVGEILESDGSEEISPENDPDSVSNPAGDTVETTPKK